MKDETVTRPRLHSILISLGILTVAIKHYTEALEEDDENVDALW